MDKRKLINRYDLLIMGIAVVLALCVYLFFFANRAAVQAEVRMHGRTVQTITLEEDKVFSLAEHPAIQFIVSNGRIAFYKSDCPDQICVRNGFLHLVGQSSVCLPNRVVLTIVSLADDEDGIDFFIDLTEVTNE